MGELPEDPGDATCAVCFKCTSCAAWSIFLVATSKHNLVVADQFYNGGYGYHEQRAYDSNHNKTFPEPYWWPKIRATEILNA